MVSINRPSKVFVGVVFALLGASFWLSTFLLFSEFRDAGWVTLLVSHSHLFFFFPVFGCLALAAFYIPSVVFTDFYWYKLGRDARSDRARDRYGRTRFVVGTLFVTVAALAFSFFYASGPRRGIWEIPPDYLRSEKVQTTAVPFCTDEAGKPCFRQPILAALQAVRSAARERWTIAEFARACRPDPYLEPPVSDAAFRHCFPAGAKLKADACCLVQRQFDDAIVDLVVRKQQRSRLSQREEVLLFAKCFFVLVIMVIGLMLVAWQDRITKEYAALLPSIERGIFVGAIAMTFWLLMDYGYQQTSDVLFGRKSTGATYRESLWIVVWAVLVVLYFAKRSMMRLSTLSGYATFGAPVVSAAATWWSYDAISNFSAKLFGSGAEIWMFALLLVAAVASVGLVYGPCKLPMPAVIPIPPVEPPVTPDAERRAVPQPPAPLDVRPVPGPGYYIVTPEELDKARQPPR